MTKQPSATKQLGLTKQLSINSGSKPIQKVKGKTIKFKTSERKSNRIDKSMDPEQKMKILNKELEDAKGSA